ncbi:MAG: nuclear transport factor 2 family protein [Bacteroidetes bacterium]|nr:nuclear transport factor 2 family protein [Bacteroidota bacterium]
MAKSATSSELEATMSRMDRAYESASKAWFDFLTDNVVVFTNTRAEPFKGKKSYREHFERALTSTKRKVTVISRQVQELGEVGIVYQVVQITQDQVVANLKQSVVWESTPKGWRINHIHSALLGEPQAELKGRQRPAAIDVINEKIASMAAVLGVAQ